MAIADRVFIDLGTGVRQLQVPKVALLEEYGIDFPQAFQLGARRRLRPPKHDERSNF